MKSFIQVVALKAGEVFSKKVVAQPTGGFTALQTAISDVMTLAGPGATFQSAVDQLNRPIDYVLVPAVAPDTDGATKIVYQVQFLPGSGPSSTTVAPVFVMAFARTSSGVTTSAEDMALNLALASVSATPISIQVMGSVDVDTTV